MEFFFTNPFLGISDIFSKFLLLLYIEKYSIVKTVKKIIVINPENGGKHIEVHT